MTDEIWAAEVHYWDCVKRKDPDGILATIHEQACLWPAPEALPVGKAQLGPGIRRRLSVVDYELTRHTTAVFGNVGIAIFTVVCTRETPDGVVRSPADHITHTWIREDGRWLLLAGMSRVASASPS